MLKRWIIPKQRKYVMRDIVFFSDPLLHFPPRYWERELRTVDTSATHRDQVRILGTILISLKRVVVAYPPVSNCYMALHILDWS